MNIKGNSESHVKKFARFQHSVKNKHNKFDYDVQDAIHVIFLASKIFNNGKRFTKLGFLSLTFFDSEIVADGFLFVMKINL